MFKQTGRILGASTLAVALGACSTTIQSSGIDLDAAKQAPEPNTARGIAYYLPRQLAKVKVTRTNVTIEKLISEVTKAEANLTEAKAAQSTAQASVDAAYEALRDANTETAAKVIEKQLADAKKLVETKKTDVEAKKGLLKKAKEDLQRAASQSESLQEALSVIDVIKIAPIQAQYEAAEEKLREAVEGALGSAIVLERAKEFEEKAKQLTAVKNEVSASTQYKVSVEISLLDPTGDPDFAYRLDPIHSILRDDTFDIEVGSSGLLKSSSVITQDRTGDILVELGRLAGGLSFDGEEEASDGGGAGESCPEKLQTYTETLDLTDVEQVKALNEKLYCLGARIETELTVNDEPQAVESIGQVNVQALVIPEAGAALAEGNDEPEEQPFDLPPLSELTGQEQSRMTSGTDDRRSWGDASQNDENTPPPTVKGIVYRTPSDFRVFIQKDMGDDRFVTDQVISLSLPQAGPISVIAQKAGAFVKTEYKLAFDNGILTRYQATRPSELAAGARIPFGIFGGIADGIAKIVQIRIDQTKKLAELSAEQLKLLNAEAEIERAGITNQTALSQAQVALANQITQAEIQAIRAEVDLTLEQEAQLERLLTQRNAQELARVNSQNALASANQTLANTLFQSQNQAIVNQTQLILSQLNQLVQQNQLTVKQAQLPVELLTTQVNAQFQSQLQRNIRACIEEKLESGITDISACVSSTDD